MSLPPKYSGHCIAGTSSAEHTLELYLDYVCPFSAKIWKQVYHHVVPWLEQEHPGKVQVGFDRNIIDLSVGQLSLRLDLNFFTVFRLFLQVIVRNQIQVWFAHPICFD